MSDLIQIVTDADGVRDLREVRRQLRGADVTADIPQSRQAQRTIIVEISDDISAEDFDPQPADQVVLLADGSGWEKVQPVQVRLLSGAGLSASEDSPVRTVAVRLGNLGWCITTTAAGSGTETVLFEIVRIERGVGLNCNAMECEVLNISCKSSLVAIGDLITVYDEIGCVFNAPQHLLIGMRGYAIRMDNPDYAQDEPLVFEEGTEDIAAPTGACRWAAQTLCCVEESI